MYQFGSIQILPQSVVDKIAAGEVVERPSSVLKELIENAIDANATRIDMSVEDSGFALIRIADNGSGMGQEDLKKCLLPHATSKITSADDLFSIATMGFRGEALASIAAVSRMTVSSSNENEGLGYLFASEGGTPEPLAPTRQLRGTTITVKDLFFNVPARKKFMKSRRSEQLAIIKMLEQIVIPFPTIHFTATVDNNRVLDLPASETPLARIAAVAGNEFAKGLRECRGTREGMDVLLYVSTPEQIKQRPRFQSLYVNLRRIDNDNVMFAIREAFASFLGFGIKPSFFCFLDIDPSRIDVNVHPTKQQIKFDDERSIFSFIYSSVRHGIAESMVSLRDVSSEPQPLMESDESVIVQNLFNSPMSADPMVAQSSGGLVEGSSEVIQAPNPFHKENPFNSSGKFSGTSERGGSSHTIIPFPGSRPGEKEVDHSRDNTIQLSKDERDGFWDLISCYQIHGMFILAPIKNGILLIDQHAAHERVLYEQALEDVKYGRSASQQLLFPIVLELSPTEKAILVSGHSYFSAFGFEIGDFGGNAFSVSAIPAFLKDGAVDETIRSMIRYLLEGKNPEQFLEPEKRFAAAFACGAAIKAGQKLSQEEMNALLNSLFSTKNPYICPHGRPTIVRMSLEELSRRFLR